MFNGKRRDVKKEKKKTLWEAVKGSLHTLTNLPCLQRTWKTLSLVGSI